MKYAFIFIFVSLFSLAKAQKKFNFDTTVLVSKGNLNIGGNGFLINDLGEKYCIASFKGALTLGNHTINTSLNSSSYFHGGIFMAKYDNQNSLVWVKKIAEADSLMRFFSKMDNKGNIIISFQYRSTLFKLNDTIINNGLSDFLILKLDSSGNEIFSKIVASNCFETIESIAIDQYNSIYFTGNFGIDANNTINYCPTYFDSLLVSNVNKTYIAKLNEFGNYDWVKTVNVNIIDNIFVENNNIYILGRTISQNNNIGGLPVTYPEPAFIHKCFIAKLDSNAHGIWARRFGSENSSIAGIGVGGLTVSGNRVYFAGGSYSGAINTYLFDGSGTLTAGSQSDYFIASYDTSGNYKWNVASQDYDDESIVQQISDINSNLISIGIFNSDIIIQNDTLINQGDYDIMVSCYDSIGGLKWVISGGGNGMDLGTNLYIDSSNRIYIAGLTTSSNGCYMGNDTLYPPSGQSTLFFASMDSIPILEPVGIKNILLNQNAFQIFPNPANSYINIQLASTITNVQLSMSNLLGQQVLTQLIEHQNSEIDISNIPNGIYFVSIKSKQGNSIQKLIIQN